MGEPVVYVDTSEIRDGKLDEVRAAVEELTGFIERHEPQLVSYTVYFGDGGKRMTVMHVHRDAASLEFHMDEAGPLFAPFADLLTLEAIDVYGAVGPALEDRLHHKADMLGGAVVRTHAFATGFVRSA